MATHCGGFYYIRLSVRLRGAGGCDAAHHHQGQMVGSYGNRFAAISKGRYLVRLYENESSDKRVNRLIHFNVSYKLEEVVTIIHYAGCLFLVLKLFDIYIPLEVEFIYHLLRIWYVIQVRRHVMWTVTDKFQKFCT